MANKNNARMTDPTMFTALGIDSKTKLPIKLTSGNRSSTKPDIKRTLRIIDEQDAVNRYTWYNIPMNLTSQDIERMLYYRGQLCFFYMESLDQFMLLPYALDGKLDAYGRFQTIRPVPFANGEDSKTPIAALLANMRLKCVYGVKLPEELTMEDLTNSAVILYDYSRQMSENITPRQVLNDPILDIMSDCIPYMRTALLNQTGVKGVRVGDADQAENVNEASRALNEAALEGDPYVPMVGGLDFQEMTNGVKGSSEEFMLALQALDNYRLSTYGIDNGGIFQKKAHELQSEADMNGGPVGLVAQDGLSWRQGFCNIINSIWNVGIWCEVSENVSQADINGDGLTYDENTNGQSGKEVDNVSE